MGKITVQFLDKEYIIPSDVVKYVEFVEFTNSVRDNLMRIFTKKIGNIEAIENANFMMDDINAEVSKFISKLLENDIYDKTANDYLKNNRGIDLFLDTKKKALRQIVSIRQEKLDVYSSGVHDAISKKEASVTGLEFGVLTSSFTNAMIYAFMDASKETEQEKAALDVYHREIAELEESIKLYDKQEQQFIINNFIPAMETVFTYLSYELLDGFVADLIRVGKFNQEALKYVDLERSNDLLKNLDLSKNKQAVIEQAFIACPFNIAVYMNAMRYEFLDVESFKTAEIFKQSDIILGFLREHLGEADYPNYKEGNYYSAVLLGEYTGENPEDIVYRHTRSYVDSVVNEYRKLMSLINNQSECDRIVRHWEDDDILAGEKAARQFAGKSVGKIVDDNTWKSLTEECGHRDLLDKLLEFIPTHESIHTKTDLDKYLREKLFVVFENARKNQEEHVVERRKREEIQCKKEEEELRKKKIKKMSVVCIITASIIFLISLPSLIDSIKEYNRKKAIETEIEKVTSELELKIESLVDDDIVIDYSYKKFAGYDSSLMWSFELKMAKFEEYRKNGENDDALLLEIMDNCRIIEIIVESENDMFNFDVEVDDGHIDISNYDGAVSYGDMSSNETFYYDEYGGGRRLYNQSTEYVLEIDKVYEDFEDDVDEESTRQQNTKTIENISHIASLLGRDIDEDGTLNLSDDDYKFVTNDVKLFGTNGCVEAGTSDVGGELHKIDIMDWTSNVGIEDLDTLIEVLEGYYGTEYVIKEYFDYSDYAYMWKDVDEFSYVICWENSNGTVTIRWMINLETEE